MNNKRKMKKKKRKTKGTFLSTSQNIQDDFINQLWASVRDPYACGIEPSFGHISSSLGFGQRNT
jgi:hypothetical protein